MHQVMFRIVALVVTVAWAQGALAVPVPPPRLKLPAVLSSTGLGCQP
jgi:hypothetical protein